MPEAKHIHAFMNGGKWHERKKITLAFSQRNVLIMARAKWTCTKIVETNIKCPLSLTLPPSTIPSAFSFFLTFFSVSGIFFCFFLFGLCSRGDIFIQTSFTLMSHENCTFWSMANGTCVSHDINVDGNGDLSFPHCKNLRQNTCRGFSCANQNQQKKKSKLRHFIPFRVIRIEVTVR